MEQLEFTAWSLYTGPSYLKNVIDNPNCPWVVGQWNGINKDTSVTEIKKDIDQRIDFVLTTFKSALAKYKTYNRHFVIPEFFFHCTEGPYPFIKIDDLYPFDYIISRLKIEFQNAIPKDNNYYNIVIGTVLTSNVVDYTSFLNSDIVSQRLNALNAILSTNTLKANSKKSSIWNRSMLLSNTSNSLAADSNDELNVLNGFMNECRANPFCTVRNRGAYFFYNKTLMPDIDVTIYEKQYESTVDLTMGMYIDANKLTHGGMITEWMANYPSYSILLGDKHTSPTSTNARFTPPIIGNNDIGVEICLDHRLQRLRRTVDMSKVNGAAANNYPLLKQIIPSGGMQILDYSVAADHNKVIFNADGCDKIYTVYGDESTVILNGNAGTFKGITCGVYNQSVQSKWLGNDGNTYYSHSQLAFATNDSTVGGFNNALGLNNLKAKTYNGTEQAPKNALTDSFQPQIIPIENKSGLFATNQGEIHYYEPI